MILCNVQPNDVAITIYSSLKESYMSREPNTDKTGNRFASATVQAIWEKATPIPSVDKNIRRKDVCGKEIRLLEYGRQTTYGWEIDHKKPVAKGGGDELDNLQPLNWETNREKNDTYPWSC
jgi:5-methylcytosine-specific restriction endonuclease McrA